jgi:hypothetical protein
MNWTKLSETVSIITTSVILVSLVYTFSTFQAIGIITAGFTAILWYANKIISKLIIHTENTK